MQHYVRRRAGPALPLYYESNDGSYSSKGAKPRSRRVPVWVFACVALCAVVALLGGFWLATPIIKAYRTQRSADHETENFFLAENK